MREIATETAVPIARLGGSFMLSREAKAFSDGTGLQGWAPYFRGRFGVLGDVDADVVAAAAGFFPAGTARRAWDAGAGLPAADAAARYAAAAHDFGRRKLAAFTEPARLADLLQIVADGADVTGAPLFAGWRAMGVPEDDRARVLHLAHVIRELRGGLHVVAVLASGLTPLEAVLSGTSPFLPHGEPNAEWFGWPRPYPEITDDTRRRRAAAERLTDELMAPAFARLRDTEAAELTVLLKEADRIVSAKG
ncbi:hypothetical protein AGRA3207_002775 [Actinomadura graeca]|uniref:Uncharacterized protein n=1 Tax=Actinomadura graeca TaxID=2750812 RepID=A0ABX8QT12_9ACTN|nr:hypothetical protein [Actinomadura graeca]QXJ21870.1 hypothetical protein AGRA3207_002775 [Actinomadura graeca]